VYKQQHECKPKPKNPAHRGFDSYESDMQKRVAVSAFKLAYIFSQIMMLVPRYAFRHVSVFFDFMICNFSGGDLDWVGSFFKMLKLGYKLKNHAGY